MSTGPEEGQARLPAQYGILAELSASATVRDGDVPAFSRHLTEVVACRLGIDRVSLWLFEERSTCLTCVDLFDLSTGCHQSGAMLRENEYRNEFIALKGTRFVDADDLLTDPRTAGYMEHYLKPLGITSLLDCVVAVGGPYRCG
jgi:hypothetical protein